MIIGYTNSSLDSEGYKEFESYLSDTFGIFFCEINKDILITTEKNPIILRDVITLYKPHIFIVKNLNQFCFSPTVISELIMFILKKGITFQSLDDNIYWNEEDMMNVYPKIFEIFRRES